MTELEYLLRTSLARATTHTRKVLGPGAMTAAEVRAFLRARTAASLATTGPAGRPHVAVTALIHHSERFFVGQSRGAASLRHLQRRPAVALVVAQGWRRHLIIEGTASVVPDGPLAAEVRAEERRRLGITSDVIVEVLPTRAFGWKSDRVSAGSSTGKRAEEGKPC